VPRSLSESYLKAIGVPMLQAWGMTETSPLATVSSARSQHDALSEEQRADVRARQGRAAPLVELRVVDPESGESQP
jgi:fatty-acyl-CoA synthase